MGLPYPQKDMSPNQARLPTPSARFLIELLVFGTVIGTILLLIEAPLWSFCIGSVLVLPLLLSELRALDSPQPRRSLMRRLWSASRSERHVVPPRYLMEMSAQMEMDERRGFSSNPVIAVLMLLAAAVTAILLLVTPGSDVTGWIVLGAFVLTLIWVFGRAYLGVAATLRLMASHLTSRHRRSSHRAPIEDDPADYPPEEPEFDTSGASGTPPNHSDGPPRRRGHEDHE
jgi:hypothetical protein